MRALRTLMVLCVCGVAAGCSNAAQHEAVLEFHALQRFNTMATAEADLLEYDLVCMAEQHDRLTHLIDDPQVAPSTKEALKPLRARCLTTGLERIYDFSHSVNGWSVRSVNAACNMMKAWPHSEEVQLKADEAIRKYETLERAAKALEKAWDAYMRGQHFVVPFRK